MSETVYFSWKQAFQVAVIFWGVPIIVFMAGYFWMEIYIRLRKKWDTCKSKDSPKKR